MFPIFLSSADLFKNQLFQKILSGILSECQTVWIQIRSDILSGQIWVQIVRKSSLGDKKVRVKLGSHFKKKDLLYSETHCFKRIFSVKRTE